MSFSTLNDKRGPYMTIETIDSLILVGVWLELGVGVFVAWMTWHIMTDRQRARIKGTVSRWLRSIGLVAAR